MFDDYDDRMLHDDPEMIVQPVCDTNTTMTRPEIRFGRYDIAIAFRGFSIPSAESVVEGVC
jgi:hypothetical protein